MGRCVTFAAFSSTASRELPEANVQVNAHLLFRLGFSKDYSRLTHLFYNPIQYEPKNRRKCK